jgi:hypothetical protein
LLQQFSSCTRIAPLLNNKVRLVAFVIDSAPKEHTLPSDLADHLIEMRP